MSTPSLRFLLLLAAVAAGVVLSGCNTTSRLRGMAVELERVTATPRPDGGADLTLTLLFRNENNVAIGVSTARHEVSLGQVSLGRVESPEAIGLPRLATATQDVPVRVDAATAARLRELQRAGTTPYRIESTLVVDAATDKLQSRTTHTGTVSLSGLSL